MSSTSRLSVIIPTTGRDSIEAAKASAAGADEILVIEDHTGDHGYTARRKGIEQATGTHLCFLDDDDAYTPDAIRLFRDAACDVPVVFRMDHPWHGILWRDPVLEFGNVGTPMFVVPNKYALLGEWKPHAPGLAEPGGDFEFLRGCAAKMGGPVWREEVVCVVRPERGPSISIITPWHNNFELASAYFRAVGFRQTQDRVLVVDDGSSQPLGFADIRLDKNLGFAAANNVGLRAAETDAVLFLNNDIVAHSHRWLEPIRDLLEPGVLVGGELRYDPHGSVDGTPMPYIDGWCLAGMTEDLRELGGWDESFEEPSYYGDNELSFRARLAGMTLKEARVPLEHLRNRTLGTPNDPNTMRVTLANKARFESRVRQALGVAA